MKKNIKNKFLSATLSVIISSSIVISSAVPVFASTNVPSAAPVTITNILSRLKNIFIPTKSLTERVTNAINSLLNNRGTISTSVINSAQSLLDSIPSSSLTNPLKQNLQSAINMAKAANKIYVLLNNNAMSSNAVKAAEAALKMIPETSQTKELRDSLKLAIEAASALSDLQTQINNSINSAVVPVTILTQAIDRTQSVLQDLLVALPIGVVSDLRNQIQNAIDRGNAIIDGI